MGHRRVRPVTGSIRREVMICGAGATVNGQLKSEHAWAAIGQAARRRPRPCPAAVAVLQLRRLHTLTETASRTSLSRPFSLCLFAPILIKLENWIVSQEVV
jgi:hypothetical protein